MEQEKKAGPTKQKGLFNWIFERRNQKNKHLNENNDLGVALTVNSNPKLAFGFGYNPVQLKNGILKYSYSHDLENGLKLYEFEPKLPYRIFNVLAKILKYKCLGSELQNNKTTIKSKYFITDKNPEEVINKVNYAINKIFEKYDPTS